MEARIRDLVSDTVSSERILSEFKLRQSSTWNLEEARRKLRQMPDPISSIIQCAYRPFDDRWCHFSFEIIDRPRRELMRHEFKHENLYLLSSRQQGIQGHYHAFVTKLVANDCVVSNRTREANQCFPEYLYSDEQYVAQTRRVNFETKLYKKLQKLAKEFDHGTPDEVQVFDYIYGVLHCPAYRQTYAEFLKIDFPRIPWPKTPDEFWDVSAKGNSLRRLHLMEPDAIGPAPYPFEGEGESVVDKPRHEGGRIWINKIQSFAGVPEISWEFFIGGYQPAQKWLKDRKGRALSFDDILQYQKTIKILSETDRIMKTITMDL